MPSIPELTAAAKAAKAAYKANKADASLKAAHKAAKAALVAGIAKAEKKAAKKAKKASKRKAEESVAAPAAKKAKVEVVDVAALTSAASAAKKAYKADKSNAALKTAYKAAKAALAAAQAAGPAGEEVKEDAPMADATPAVDNVLAGLKKTKPAAANHSDNAPNPKCFVGNLSWDIDDDACREFFKDCGALTDIFWLTDRDSGKFKGCGFITFETVEAAVAAVAKNGEMCMGRDIKVDFAAPRPNKSGGSKKFSARPLSEKPEGCDTCFCGNLSFDIDDDQMREFAKDCGEINKIRWLTDRDTGDFKGCGFVEFASTDAVDLFVKKNGEQLLGRDIRIDYAKPRAPKTW